MPSRPISLFSDLPLDTPPLSPSRSPSSTSATRSSAASSKSSINLGDLGTRMSQTRIDPPISVELAEGADVQDVFHKLHHDGMMFDESREKDLQEGLDVDMEQYNVSHDRGRSGYEENLASSRPSLLRQLSYSKRHSSFDTPREIPYPYGYLESSMSDDPSPSPAREATDESPSGVPMGPQAPEPSSECRMDTAGDPSFDESSTGDVADSSPAAIYGTERNSTTSLPLPSSVPYSSLPHLGSPDSPSYENQRPLPLVPNTSMKPATSPPRRSPPKRPMTKTQTYFRSSGPSRLAGHGSSPPILEDELETINDQSDISSEHPSFDARSHSSLPLPDRYTSPVSSSSSRPISLPNGRAFMSQSHFGSSYLPPPPQPPTILTPPPPLSPDEESARKPAPYEPFLPRGQPPPDTYIAVETVTSEYRLSVRLPGFQRDSITLAMRRRRILHVVADNWSDGGGHFERRISFGYDADLGSVRAEFDGEVLRIIVPRRTLSTCYSQPST